MADKDVNIKLKLQGSEQVQQQTETVAQAFERLGYTTGSTSKQGAEGVDELGESAKKTGGIFGGMGDKIASWAIRLAGVMAILTGITKAINEQSGAIKEHSDITEKQQEKLVRLQHLGDFYKERPELRKEVASLAEYGRRDVGEVADAWYNLRSKAGGLSDSQQMGILKEAIEFGRTDPSVSLDVLVDMMSLYAKKTGETDANKIQNVMSKTVREAGSNTEGAASYMPRFLPVGMEAGLSGSETAGLWAWGTTQEADPSVATTGLRNVVMSLMGKGTPESNRLMKNLGVNDNMDFYKKIETLSKQYAAGNIGLSEAEQIGQREGSVMLLNLLKDPDEMRRVVRSVQSADRGDIDLTRESINGLLGTDEVARLADLSNWLDVKNENSKGKDVGALRLEVAKKLSEYNARKNDIPAAGIALAKKTQDIMGGVLDLTPGLSKEDMPINNLVDDPLLYQKLYNPLPAATPGKNGGDIHIHYHNDVINDVGKSDYKPARFTQE
jgi:hypothetical protein